MDNATLEALGLDGQQRNTYWQDKTTQAALTKVDPTNRQGLLDSIAVGLTALDNIIASGNAAEKTLAGIQKKVLLYIQSELS